ncbi:SCO6745 family protein [Actinomadura fibrosa]|uniref:EvbL n=1 Tax=Actinomadura fibrosa TaxID=111802 RepID=A0ABW2XQC6_9ACTN|nr:evbL [Actinomadura fibrosa]
MGGLSAAETVKAADRIVHDVGSAWMLDRTTAERGKQLGFDNPLAFYFAGRGGVLGDVDADVVVAALGWFEPGLVRAMWDEGVAVAGAREAARRYGRACAAWGEERLAELEGVERLAELAERVVRAAEGSGLPLFCGWRAEPAPEAGPGRLNHFLHVLREWRGALHLAATTAAGLAPLEAILTDDGPGQARMFGWQGDLPDCAALVGRRREAEATTDRLAAAVYERALSPAERSEFAGLVGATGAAVLG